MGCAQLSSCPGAGWEQFSHGMGTAAQLCCTHPTLCLGAGWEISSP